MITTVSRLTSAEREAVSLLASTVAEEDGVYPLNEEATLAMKTDGATHYLAHNSAHDHTVLLGYAVRLVSGSPTEHTNTDDCVQMMVDPRYRRQGVATTLVKACADRLRGHTPDLWAFGDTEAARGFARARGYEPVRTILVMEADVTRARAPRALASIRCDHYRLGDLDCLVGLNARAFANHAEQGRLTTHDFEARMACSWFSPDDLLLARAADGHIRGFHWMKVEEGIGEVYIIGVDPAWMGQGVGGFLLEEGLRRMGERGITTARLWVEADAVPARTLYAKVGFSVVRADLRYRKGARIDAPSGKSSAHRS